MSREVRLIRVILGVDSGNDRICKTRKVTFSGGWLNKVIYLFVLEALKSWKHDLRKCCFSVSFLNTSVLSLQTFYAKFDYHDEQVVVSNHFISGLG